jgi:PAB-dependent poly(A)-specific ribonuclease subunit 3
LNGCGILDIIAYGNGASINQLQQDDLIEFGRLILSLSCGTMLASHNLRRSMDFVANKYSTDIKNMLIYLLSKPAQYKTIDEAVQLIGQRLMGVLNDVQLYLFYYKIFSYNDTLENELKKELENGKNF